MACDAHAHAAHRHSSSPCPRVRCLRARAMLLRLRLMRHTPRVLVVLGVDGNSAARGGLLLACRRSLTSRGASQAVWPAACAVRVASQAPGVGSL